MRRKRESLLLPKLLKKIAPQIGAKVCIEPEWGVAGQITFKSGRKRYFRHNTLDLNPVGASDIAKDKDYAAFFMKRMGYRTVQGKAFYSIDWCKAIGSKRNIHSAYAYARTLGFPVVVKPNSGSQGVDVYLVHNRRDFFRSLRSIFKSDKIALVQRQARGADYRIVVLDKKIISAYERIPLNVMGDGYSTIKQLFARKMRAFTTVSRDTRIKFNDPRIKNKLFYQGKTLVDIPRHGELIFLLDNANLSSGGEAVDVTKTLHPEFKKIAIRLTRDMGLRLSGVDLMVEGDIRNAPETYRILEINAAPGLDHYVKGGKEQERIVEALYLKVLKSLAR